MRLLFVTGANSAFFGTLLIFLQSFFENFGTEKIHVCDFGLDPRAAGFLDELGMLLAMPPKVSTYTDPVKSKSALGEYLRHNQVNLSGYDALVWLDGDLTILGDCRHLFFHVAEEMIRQNIDVALCREISNRTIDQIFDCAEGMEPFRAAVREQGIDPRHAYFSTGVVFCRSEPLLSLWQSETDRLERHPLYEQNAFNIVIHKTARPVIALDCAVWQMQGPGLDDVEFAENGDGRATARIDGKDIISLHTTTSKSGQLQCINARMVHEDVALEATYKIFTRTDFVNHQVQLLARFVQQRAALLLKHGICHRTATKADGFVFEATSYQSIKW